MKLVIDRSKWLRGEGTEVSKLLRKGDAKMCCLGFLARACGVDPFDMIDVAVPAELPYRTIAREVPDTPIARLVAKELRLTNDLMSANDDEGAEGPEREEHIKALLAQIDVEVEFVDGMRPIEFV